MFLAGVGRFQGSMRCGGRDLVGFGLGDVALALVVVIDGMKHGLVGWSPIAVLGCVLYLVLCCVVVGGCAMSLCFFLSGRGFVL